jgi:hypothetical protein
MELEAPGFLAILFFIESRAAIRVAIALLNRDCL